MTDLEAYKVVDNYINYLEGKGCDTALLNLDLIKKSRRQVYLYMTSGEVAQTWQKCPNLGALPERKEKV